MIKEKISLDEEHIRIHNEKVRKRTKEIVERVFKEIGQLSIDNVPDHIESNDYLLMLNKKNDKLVINVFDINEEGSLLFSIIMNADMKTNKWDIPERITKNIL